MGMAEWVWLCALVEKFWKKSHRLESQRISRCGIEKLECFHVACAVHGKGESSEHRLPRSTLGSRTGERSLIGRMSSVKELHMISCPHTEVLCVGDNHFSPPALSPDINVRVPGLDFKRIELSSYCRLLYWSCLVLRLHVFPNLMGVIYMYFDSSWELWTDCAQFRGVRLNFQWKHSGLQSLLIALAREETRTPSRNSGKTP